MEWPTETRGKFYGFDLVYFLWDCKMTALDKVGKVAIGEKMEGDVRGSMGFNFFNSVLNVKLNQIYWDWK